MVVNTPMIAFRQKSPTFFTPSYSQVENRQRPKLRKISGGGHSTGSRAELVNSHEPEWQDVLIAKLIETARNFVATDRPLTDFVNLCAQDLRALLSSLNEQATTPDLTIERPDYSTPFVPLILDYGEQFKGWISRLLALDPYPVMDEYTSQALFNHTLLINALGVLAAAHDFHGVELSAERIEEGHRLIEDSFRNMIRLVRTQWLEQRPEKSNVSNKNRFSEEQLAEAADFNRSFIDETVVEGLEDVKW